MVSPWPGRIWPNHGGQPAALSKYLGLDTPSPQVDFSANLNPWGPPVWLKSFLGECLEDASFTRYPDPHYQAPCEAIAAFHGLAPEQVLLTNGGAEAIFLAAALHAGRRAMILQPTFSEYARACGHYGLAITPIGLEAPDFQLKEADIDAALSNTDLVFLCRPNNPSGTLVKKRDLAALLERASAQSIAVVVDEAFIDFVADPNESLVSWLAHYANLILLRSLTKLYAIPGLRLGYMLASPDTIRRAHALQLPWSVNAFAAALVAPLLEDRTFAAHTRDRLREEWARLAPALAQLGFETSATRANFYLLRKRGTDTDALLVFLLQAGLAPRHTHNFPGLDGGWLRLAIRSRQENDRLLARLAAWQG